MIAASLTRHEVPLTDVPHLPEALLKFSRIIGEVPRDTLYSYGPRNPRNGRIRTFSGTPQERVLIESFATGASVSLRCVALLVEAHRIGPAREAASDRVNQATRELRGLVDTMVAVRTRISPEVFTYEIRPYFQPYRVGDAVYIATGGGQIPVFLIDALAWVSGPRAPVLHHYNRENAAYLPEHLRLLVDELEGVPSLLSRCSAVVQAGRDSTVIAKTLKALDLLIATLERFRFPHKRVTDENLRLKSYGPHQRQVLDRVIVETSRARSRVHRMLGRLQATQQQGRQNGTQTDQSG